MYNQKVITATTTSPYFTPAVIDTKCNECANSNNPQIMTVACDICKTMTVSQISTYNYFDFFVYIGILIIPLVVIRFFIKKK